MGLVIKWLLFNITAIMLICFVPGIPPYENFEVIQINPAQELVGALAPNNYLDLGERLHEGMLEGPESIAIKNDHEIFVGLVNGSIAKLSGQSFEKLTIVSHNPLCDKYKHEGICGRPLGMRYLSNDKILVADGLHGIYIFDAKTGKRETLVKHDVHIKNKMPLVINDLDIDKEGNIYWSHSSTKTNLTSAVLDTLIGPSGRLLKYHSKTRKNEVLIDNLYFANGVQLSRDQSYVLVAECMGRQVHRYWIKGDRKGKRDVFLSNLPGNPDNIRARPEGGFYVSLIATVDANMPDFMAVLGKYPAIRRFLARFMTGIKLTADWTDNIFPNYYSKSISSKIFHLASVGELIGNNLAIVIEVDEDANIVGSLQGRSKVINAVSETQRVGNTLLFGSPFMKFLGKLDINTLEKAKQTASKSNKKDEL